MNSTINKLKKSIQSESNKFLTSVKSIVSIIIELTFLLFDVIDFKFYKFWSK